MSDIYYSPAKFGLEIIWTAEQDESYQFDIVAAWGSTLTGAVYIGRDSGCSCPSPFEDYTAPDSVNELTRVDPHRGREEARKAILQVMGDWTPEYFGWGEQASKGQAARERHASEGADKILAWAANRIRAVSA